MRIPAVWFAASAFLPMASVARETLASRFSGEWRSLHSEVSAIENQLAGLPDIRYRYEADIRNFLRFFLKTEAVLESGIDMTIRLEFPEPRMVDLVALVPARKLEAQGLDSNYGFPEDFTVSLIGPDETRHLIASYRSTSDHPVHRGHPIVARAAGSPLATGLEIHMTRARTQRPGKPDLAVIALSEILCFSGNRNIAPDAIVTVESNAMMNPSSYWNDELLVDGIMPLGLPELPGTEGEIRSIGWVSHAHKTANKRLTITMDLGEPRHIDSLRLYPALRPSVDDFTGFGIPQHFRLLGGNDSAHPGDRVLLNHTPQAVSALGHNPHPFRFPGAKVRYVQLDATLLWKPYDDYPAFLAFSEIELLNGDDVVSRGATVTVPELDEIVPAYHEMFWNPASLTDGRGPQGELVSIRRWIEMLDERLSLETRRHHAYERMEELEHRWQSGAMAASSAGGVLALMFVFIQRLRHSRQLLETRRRIAGELHDDVGSNLGSIRMLSELARGKPDNREELHTIGKVAADTITSVRDIVWLLEPGTTDRTGIVDHLRESAAAMLDPLEWTLASDFRDWRLGDVDRRHLALFFRESLHNIRHARATSVDIQLGNHRGELVLTIADDGCGLSEELMEKPSTLRALRQRAGHLGGLLAVDSKTGAGTTLKLSFKPRAPGSAKTPTTDSDPP